MRFIAVSFLLSTVVFGQASVRDGLRDVVHAELLFSHSSVVHGKKAAFLEFFDDSCVTFNPLPVKAKPLYRGLPVWTRILTWKPSLVEISGSGDLAYSTGPWEIRESKLSDPPILCGHYFSIWEKSGTEWKVIFDTGIRYPLQEAKEEKLLCRLPLDTLEKKRNTLNTKAALLDAEEKFTGTIRTGSYDAAFNDYASQNTLMYRNGKFPLEGKAAAFREIVNDRRAYRFIPYTVTMSNSGDLAYTYGIAVTMEHDTSTYVRVWRKEDTWKIAVDMMNSIHE